MPFVPARLWSPSTPSRIFRRLIARLGQFSAARRNLLLLLAALVLMPGMAAAQTAVYSGATLLLGGGYANPTGIAVDSSGNVYVGDVSNEAVFVMPAGCASSSCVTTVGGGFHSPYGVAVDSSGNVYLADVEDHVVYKMPPGCKDSSCVTTVGGGFQRPQGVAVDSSGNVYVPDYSAQNVYKIPPGCASYSCVTTVGGGFSELTGVAVDSSGNVYVTDEGTEGVDKIPPGCTTYSCVTTLGGGFYVPKGIAVDSFGNVYVSQLFGGAGGLKEIPAGCTSSTCVTTLSNTTSSPWGVAVDGSGDVYVADDTATVSELMLQSANFFSVPVGSKSTTLSIPFTFTSAGTISEVAYRTNFTLPGTGTCFTQNPTYSVGGTCTVDVQFSPTSPGPLYGAVSLLNNASTPVIVGTALVQGTGVAPQTVFTPATVATLGGGFNSLDGIAVDPQGNIYVTNDDNNAVEEMPPGCASSSCVTILGGGFNSPSEVAVDGAGNVYVADYLNVSVKEMPAGCASAACVSTLGGGFINPNGIAVDGSGNIYVADAFSAAVKEMPPGCASAACVTTLGGGFNNPDGIGVDGAGNVYVADYFNDSVTEMPPGCASAACVTTLGGGFKQPTGVSLDAAGNVYVADYGNNAVKVIPPGCKSSGCVSALYSNFTDPSAVALDSNGNVYAVQFTTPVAAVKEIKRATPPTISFATTPAGQISTDSPKKVTVQNIGNAALNISSLNFPFDFPEDINLPANECPGSGSLASGKKCLLSIDFLPFPESVTGVSTLLQETVDLTDNNLNGSVTQSVTVKGTETVTRASVTSPAPGSVLPGPTVTFNWSSGSGGVTGYILWLGTAAGSNNLFDSGTITTTSVTVPGLPINGKKVYARLFTIYESGAQLYNAYSYTAATQAALTSPGSNTVLNGPKVTFTWSAGNGATSYGLWLGTTVGSNNIYSSGAVTTTSATPANLPTNGSTIHARLITHYGAGQAYTDYVYTAATRAALTLPTPGTVLAGANVTFNWSAATGSPTGYGFRLGTTVGGNNIYSSGTVSTTSVTRTNLPTNGEIIHARLFTFYGTIQVYTDYIYHAAP